MRLNETVKNLYYSFVCATGAFAFNTLDAPYDGGLLYHIANTGWDGLGFAAKVFFFYGVTAPFAKSQLPEYSKFWFPFVATIELLSQFTWEFGQYMNIFPGECKLEDILTYMGTYSLLTGKHFLDQKRNSIKNRLVQ